MTKWLYRLTGASIPELSCFRRGNIPKILKTQTISNRIIIQKVVIISEILVIIRNKKSDKTSQYPYL